MWELGHARFWPGVLSPPARVGSTKRYWFGWSGTAPGCGGDSHEILPTLRQLPLRLRGPSPVKPCNGSRAAAAVRRAIPARCAGSIKIPSPSCRRTSWSRNGSRIDAGQGLGPGPLTIRSRCPDGGELRTLRDAGNYIAKLPKREHDTPAWRAAIQALMLVVEHGGDTMLPRIGIMRALYPAATAPTPRKRARKYRIVR